MNFYVYLICTKNNNNSLISYVGYTNDIKKRINLHNSSKGAKFTRGRKWKLIYKKKFKNKVEAMKYEYILKRNYNLRKNLKQLFLKNEKN
ncbi:GIY-YIG nuclease family protein [Candidatus Pelagibacter sp. HIMB1623]|uniref:GIY-YIG nuclease family protein n=1 Tax=unclassified Candidatus Pelagibacter TaxID=2647897 RepID=UPI003F857786